MRRVLSIVCLASWVAIAAPGPASAAGWDGLPGWSVTETSHSYKDLIERLNKAVKANKMGLVTRASATLGAKSQG